MTPEVEQMSAELRDELAANDVRRMSDPREQPVRFSHLKSMGMSAAHCLNSFRNDERRESLAMRVGSGSHALMFGQQVVTYPGKVRRGKDYDAFKSCNPSAIILSAKEMMKAQSIALALRSHPRARELMHAPGVIYERTILWEQNGRRRRSTPDALVPGKYIIDLKTTRCAEPGKFARDAARMAYHGQLADYRDAVEATTGHRLPCYIIAVESEAPYNVSVMPLTDRALDKGQALVRLWFERLRACEDSGSWPGYCEAETPFDVPDDDFAGLVFGDEESADGDGDESEVRP